MPNFTPCFRKITACSMSHLLEKKIAEYIGEHKYIILHAVFMLDPNKVMITVLQEDYLFKQMVWELNMQTERKW